MKGEGEYSFLRNEGGTNTIPHIWRFRGVSGKNDMCGGENRYSLRGTKNECISPNTPAGCCARDGEVNVMRKT
jgi:hypothetical protein